MEVVSDEMFRRPNRKIRVMQFGEGDFLRGFADWILQDLDVKNQMDAGVVCVQPREGNGIENLAAQDGLYTLILEGIEGKYKVRWSRVMDVIQDCLDPYVEYERFLDFGESEDLEIVISNTSERGIVFDENDVDFEKCPASFPGKLLSLLERRYERFEGKGHGLAIIPCENEEDNGDDLRDCLVKLSEKRKMGDKFIKWLTTENHFVSTLGDRIVAGYPIDETASMQEQTGYIDNCAVKGEYYHEWVLKKDEFVQGVFPADKTGLNVKFVDDVKPYRMRKERMLDGAHTALASVAYMCGMDTVGGAMLDPAIEKFVEELIFAEAGYTVGGSEEETKKYGAEVLDRLNNPYIKHNLSDIAANSTTKFTASLLPVLKDYVKVKDALPKCTVFALAALVFYCRGKRGKENIESMGDEEYMAKWADIWQTCDEKWDEMAKAVLSWKKAWGEDLRDGHADLQKELSEDLKAIAEKGMKEALEDLVND